MRVLIHPGHVAILLLISCGCGRPENATDVDAASNRQRQEPAKDGFTLRVTVNSPDKPDTDLRDFERPDDEKIREEFSSIDWDNPDVDAGIVLFQKKPFDLIIGVKGNLHKGLLAQWNERAAGDSNWQYRYAESISKDDALQLLLSANNQNEAFRSMVAWEVDE